MKKITTTFITALLATSASFAQLVTDTVHTAPTYANDNYYQLSTGNQFTVDRSNWDLAFASDGVSSFSSSIRINGGTGTELYLYSSDTSQWNTIDTTGFNWSQNSMVNTDTSWLVGAFENRPLTSAFDLGWGTYNSITHQIIGDQLYVIKLADGSFKKLFIESLMSGVYTIRYANLDGSGLTVDSVSKSNYSGKNFGYYSLQNGSVIDREPSSTSWDLLFTRYITMLAPNTSYAVTGVLAHQNVKVAQVDQVNDVYTETHLGHTYNSEINVIGWDWKSFNLGTFQFEVEDSLVYFVEDQNAVIYRLVFTGFTGTSAGEYHLVREQVGTVGIDDEVSQNTILNTYPNPAKDQVTVTFNALGEQTVLSVINLMGQELIRKEVNTIKGLSQETIMLNELPRGTYLLQIRSNNNNSVQKLIIQ